MIAEISAQPFVKRAGGKGQLLGQVKASLPKRFSEYIEPLVDGGAVYFDLQPRRSIINDINESLINACLQIKISSEEFANTISEYDERITDGEKEYCYKIREFYNNKMMRAGYDMN